MKHTITLIPGDGIGPEIASATTRILEAAGAEIEWESFLVGQEAIARHHDALPKELLDSIVRNKLALKGPLTTPVGTGFASINVRLRRELDLYANLRPVRSLPGVPGKYGDVDLVVVRENTEDLYSGLEHTVVPGVVESLKIITEKACTRIAQFAFEYAIREQRERVTAVHKANIMKLSDGLFLDCFYRVAIEHPELTADDRIVDNACMQLVMHPQQFDILLMENLYGDIISDLAAGLVGGLGTVPSANIGTSAAIFEAIHGSAPDIAGRNVANPVALLRSAMMLLTHAGEHEIADRISLALLRVIAQQQVRTRDLGGTATTTEFTDAVIEALA